MSILTSIFLAPLIGALLVVLIPRNYRFVIRCVALLATLISAVLAVKMFVLFKAGSPGYQFQQILPWVRSLGISFHVGVDGVNVGLILMGAIVAFAATCVSKEIKSREKEFYLLLLVMAGGILAAFASLDLFFFYFFHELALVPTFIMIGVWGYGVRKNYATFQITLYLSLGALIALAGLIALYLNLAQANYMPRDAAYSGAPAAEATAQVDVVQGQLCSWTKGTNDLRLANGTNLLTNSGSFVAATNFVLLTGKTNAPVTAVVRNQPTFDIPVMTAVFRKAPVPIAAQRLIFPLLLFGFGILVSLWPFHTWAPLGYGSAPTATAMLHAGVLKKFGLYGLIRLAVPLLPEGAKPWLHVLAVLCLGNILYCGWVAMRQRDLGLLLGYSSVAHMGFAFLGIASLSLLGLTGAVLVMVAHGFLAALAFGLSGYLRQHLGTLRIGEMGGLLKRLPFVGAVLVMAMFAGCGLPGFANFPGELLVMFGAWKALPGFVVAAAWGALLVGAIYALRAVRHILHGPLPEQWIGVPDANWWRKLPFALLLASLLTFGVCPQLLVAKIEPGVHRILKGEEAPAAKAIKKKPVRPPQTRPRRGFRSNASFNPAPAWLGFRFDLDRFPAS
jgi:NADH:ubiquinone oxidoreductase subunit 4 (subunit M)